MDGWNTNFLLGWPISRCYLRFREGIYECHSWPIVLCSMNVHTHSQHSCWHGCLALHNCWMCLSTLWGCESAPLFVIPLPVYFKSIFFTLSSPVDGMCCRKIRHRWCSAHQPEKKTKNQSQRDITWYYIGFLLSTVSIPQKHPKHLQFRSDCHGSMASLEPAEHAGITDVRDLRRPTFSRSASVAKRASG